MGPVLFQLPPKLPFNAVKTEKLFALCKLDYAAFDFALEVRRESWLSNEARKLIERYEIAFVIAQSGNFFPYTECVTAPHIYLRFHGPAALYASKYEANML